MKPAIPSEQQEQAALFQWAELAAKVEWPELKAMFAIPNGGKRSKITGAFLKAAGVKRGVPDICLPVPRGRYTGLWIELKKTKGSGPSAEQKAWGERLRAYHASWHVCRGWEHAKAVILDYLEGRH